MTQTLVEWSATLCQGAFESCLGHFMNFFYSWLEKKLKNFLNLAFADEKSTAHYRKNFKKINWKLGKSGSLTNSSPIPKELYIHPAVKTIFPHSFHKGSYSNFNQSIQFIGKSKMWASVVCTNKTIEWVRLKGSTPLQHQNCSAYFQRLPRFDYFWKIFSTSHG